MDWHKEPRDTTQRGDRTHPRVTPALALGWAWSPPTPQGSTGPLQCLVGAVLGLDELDDEEGDGLDTQHQHHAPDETGRVEAGRVKLRAVRQWGTGGGGPWWPGKMGELWGFCWHP